LAPFVKGAATSTASHRAFRDDREPPLLSGETRRETPLICPTRQAEYFSQKGWTGFFDLPDGHTQTADRPRSVHVSPSSSAVPIGVPQPDTASNPLVALKPLFGLGLVVLLPTVTSWQTSCPSGPP